VITRTEKCGRLRFVVPDATSIERPRLQQEFQITEYCDGLVASESREWRDVPVVVVSDATPKSNPRGQ
jgi:hypothetical protein